jgi:signal peptidase I
MTPTEQDKELREKLAAIEHERWADWQRYVHSVCYENKGIGKNEFESYSFKNGINKGDIIFVVGDENIEKGEVIIFIGGTKYPIIHRVVSTDSLSTKGDNNDDQLPGGIEQNINKNKVLGRAVFRVPYLGWVKLIFFDFFKPIDQRGFCK